MIKVIYIADELVDYCGIARSFVDSKVCRPRKLRMKDIDYRFFSLQNGKPHSINILELPGIIRGADVVLFDYGGFDVCGQDNYRLIDHYSRFFLKVIEDNPSKEWWCVSALPKNCFDDDELDRLEELGVDFAWA